jgi:hypothetical protein
MFSYPTRASSRSRLVDDTILSRQKTMSRDKAKGESMKRVRREIVDLVRGTGESVGRLTSPQKEKGGSTIFNRTGKKDRRTNLQGVRKHRRQSVKEGAVTQGVGNPDSLPWSVQ